MRELILNVEGVRKSEKVKKHCSRTSITAGRVPRESQRASWRHTQRVSEREGISRGWLIRKAGPLSLDVQFVDNRRGEEVVQRLQQCEEVVRPDCIVHNIDDD